MKRIILLIFTFLTLTNPLLYANGDDAEQAAAAIEAEVIARLQAEMQAVAEGLSTATQAWQEGDVAKAWEIVATLSQQYPENHRVEAVLADMKVALTQAIQEAREADLARFKVNRSSELGAVERMKYSLAVSQIDNALFAGEIDDPTELAEAFMVFDKLLETYPHMVDGQLYSAHLAIAFDDPVRGRAAAAMLLHLGFDEWRHQSPALNELHAACRERGWMQPAQAETDQPADEAPSENPALKRIREALKR